MNPGFFLLSCQHCGAKMEIYADMTRFSCANCGVELAVERRGGTVSVKSIGQPVQCTRTAIDKPGAAHLLERLMSELHAKTAESESYKREITRAKDAWQPALFIFCFGVFVGGPIIWGAGIPVILGAATVSASVAFFFCRYGGPTPPAELPGKLSTVEREMDELKKLISEAEQITNR